MEGTVGPQNLKIPGQKLFKSNEMNKFHGISESFYGKCSSFFLREID